MITRGKRGIIKPKAPFAGSIVALSVPKSVAAALSDPTWLNAMKTEFKALQLSHTWSLVPWSPNMHIVGSKWIFKLKYNSDGSIDRPKARLVAQGFTQTPGLDFHDTFNPVIKPATVRIILTIAAFLHWPVYQIDVNNAFLNGSLHETVYMQQPEGFEDPQKPSHVCLLYKALYGLKQAPRAWFEKLRATLLCWGFTHSKADTSLFFLVSASKILFVLIYVDDIIITANKKFFLTAFIQQPHSVFALKDLGPLHYFLDIQVSRNSIGFFFLTQAKYGQDILAKFSMDKASPCPTPMTLNLSLPANEGSPLSDPTLYRKAIGCLQYLTYTRPDLSFAVNKLSHYLQHPTDLHWKALKRIFRYTKGTLGARIHIKGTSDHYFRSFNDLLPITGYSDADWAAYKDDRKSVRGYCVYLGDSLISWSSRKQHTVTRSSTESEYRSLSNWAAEII